MNPGLKLFDRLSNNEQTKTKAQEFLSVLKELRPGQGTSSLPNGALSICAYLASEYTQQADISPSAAFQESKLPNLKSFTQSIGGIEDLLCEASNRNNSTLGEFTYTRLATNSPRCRRCSNDNIPCIALRKICGKRETNFCFACMALKVRSCQIPEVIDLLSDDDTQPAEPSNTPSIHPIKCEPVDHSFEVARPVANATPSTQQPHVTEAPFKYRQSLPLSSPRPSFGPPPRSSVAPPSPLSPPMDPGPSRPVPQQANPTSTSKSTSLGTMPASVPSVATPAAKRAAQGTSKAPSDASSQSTRIQVAGAALRTPPIPQTPSQPRAPRMRKSTETTATPGPSRVKKEGEKKGKAAPTPRKRELDIPTNLDPVFDDDGPVTIPIISRRRTSTGGKRFGNEVKEEATPVVKKKKRKLGLFTSAETIRLPPLVVPERPAALNAAQAPMTPRATPAPLSAVDASASASGDPMDVDPPRTTPTSESVSAPAVLQHPPTSASDAPATFQQPSPLPTPPLTNYVPSLYELPEWVVSHVRAKAYEIIAHVERFGCESPAISFPISDMRHRLAMIHRQESAGTEDSLLVFKQMLLKSGKDVVSAFVREGTQDPVLECLITELGERLGRMEESSVH